jgi:hypothetical protein
MIQSNGEVRVLKRKVHSRKEVNLDSSLLTSVLTVEVIHHCHSFHYNAGTPITDSHFEVLTSLSLSNSVCVVCVLNSLRSSFSLLV